MRSADNRCQFTQAQSSDIEFLEKVIHDMGNRLSLKQQAGKIHYIPYSSNYDEFRKKYGPIFHEAQSTDQKLTDCFKRFIDCCIKTRDYFMSLQRTSSSILLKDLFGHGICDEREFRFHRELNNKAKTILYFANKIHASHYTDPRIYDDLIEFTKLNDALILKMSRDVVRGDNQEINIIASKCK